MKTIPKAFEPSQFEDKIYENWEKSGYFRPEAVARNKKQETRNKQELSFSYDRKIDGKPFVISMPPSNVTGKLHLGHAIVMTLEDLMIRYHRLKGEPTLWLPGTDHAGIATQAVVDKALRKEGINKNELGREKFVERVWQWKEEYGGIIGQQVRKMGASCDWSRERFTLDEGLSEAVKEAFVTLYNKGLIYRGEYIVNWCPRCHTAISDDEVDHIEQQTKLYYFKYDKDFPITIATTRPETKLGDAGVAVNPKDKRYADFIGKEFKVHIDGVKRTIKVFADRNVDMEFGTGAVGVTPAHSAIDWKMAEENDLPKIKVIDENGRMTPEAGQYEGLKAKEAGEKLAEYLRSNNLMEKEEDYANNLSVCSRCNTPIEPLPSKQWFVKMKPLAEKAKKAVKDKEIEIIPKRFDKVYFHWMDNIKDWCISRQIWWGHRLPVYYRKQETVESGKLKVESKEDIYVGVKPPKDIENWVQDEDVLDTWFSSALWPFSTLGWPQKTKDLEYFYPTTVLETGYDILFFWVARMIMMGLELTGKIPFEKVYLHGLIRDENNVKMTKSIGNVINPLDVIEKYGADALRISLIVGATPGQDMAMGETKIKGYRNFTNKIWNASRFVMLRVTEGDLQSGETGTAVIKNLSIDEKLLTSADKKILKTHEEIKKIVTKKFDEYKFSQAGEFLYEYFWHQFCDEYIEQAKKQLSSGMDSEQNRQRNDQVAENTKKVLVKVLSETLIMLHPFVPFVTEAVWQELKNIYKDLSESIIIANWPE